MQSAQRGVYLYSIPCTSKVCLVLKWLGNMQPLVMERIPSAETGKPGGPAAWQHTKALYRLSGESRLLLQVIFGKHIYRL